MTSPVSVLYSIMLDVTGQSVPHQQPMHCHEKKQHEAIFVFEHVQTLSGSSPKQRLTAFSTFLIPYTIVHNHTRFADSDRFYREGERSSFCDSYMILHDTRCLC